MKNRAQERRRYLRLDTINIVDVVVDRKLIKRPSQFISAFTKNISVEGMCFFSDKPFARGKRLQIRMHLPGDPKPLKIRGQVCWVQSLKDREKDKENFEIGVKLFTVDENDASRFMGYVCSRMAARLGRYLHL